MTPPGGTIQHLLVLVNPAADPPWDPEGDALPTDAQAVWFTSMRRQNHPFIAQVGSGATARADISIGGQRLELPLGRTRDGECQIRIIDAPAPVTVVSCDINAVVVDEEASGMHLDTTAFSSGKWVVNAVDHPLTSKPSADWGANSNGPILGTFALFGWLDAGNWVRETYVEAIVDGTEDGGPGFTPGNKYGVRFRINTTLDTGPGNPFIEIEDANGTHRVSGIPPGFNFWEIPNDPLNQQVDLVIWGTANASGEIIVRVGLEGAYPSFNIVFQFEDIQVVECADVVTGLEAERYYTGTLADANARQQQLGWPYYYKQSFDQGLTWPVIAYAGFLKSSVMERSLTWLLTGGDNGKGRRVSRAWSDLDPMEDFTP